MISGWKRAAIKNMAAGFSKDDGGTAKEAAAEIDKLHSKIGQLVLLGHASMPCQPAGGTGFFSERLGSVARDTRQKMVSRDLDLSVRRQCKLLSLVRSGFYCSPKGESAANLGFMEIIDKQFLETPWYGSRQMARHMQRHGHKCGRHRVRRLMRLMRLVPIYQAPNTSKKHPQHKIYPYLLRGMKIERPNHVWCTDITYTPMRRGFLYLVAIMDWAARKVLAWRLSNTMEVGFCIDALKEALAKYGKPEIFNTDQGSQFTSYEFTQVLKDAEIQISMDGRGRWIDNRMIERLWRSLKYECVYLRAFETGSEAKTKIGKWLTYYNTDRPHSTHGILTPSEVYDRKTEPAKLAA